MKKIFEIEVDCPVCAGKIENAIARLDGVAEVSVNFITQKLSLEAEENEFDRIVKEAIKVARKVEPDFELR